MNEKTDTTIRRGKTGGYSSAKLQAKRNRKREEALDRQAEHDTLTVEEKIAKARDRRGNSKRELARLNKEAPTKTEPVKKVATKKKAAKKA